MRCLEKIKLMQKKRKIRIFKSLIGMIVLLLFICNIKYASNALLYGMQSCVINVIPSLFPLMIASDLLCFAELKYGSNTALLLGWVFGSPLCALQAERMYSKGMISTEEYEMLCCIGGIPSVGFYLGVCGNMFGIKGAVMLYFTSVFSALICRCVIFHSTITNQHRTNEEIQEHNVGVISLLSRLLKQSADRCITIISCVAFFYMISSCITKDIDNDILKAVIFGFFEFSGGCKKCSLLGERIGYIICSIIVSFSGISVFMQIRGVCSDRSIPVKTTKYFLSRGFMSALSGVISLAVISKNVQLRVIVLIFILLIVTLSQIINKKTLNKIKNNSIITAKDM